MATSPTSNNCILNPGDLLTPPVHSFNSFKSWQNREVHWACSPFYFSRLCSLTTRQANTWGTGISSYSVGIQGQTHKVLCTLLFCIRLQAIALSCCTRRWETCHLQQRIPQFLQKKLITGHMQSLTENTPGRPTCCCRSCSLVMMQCV